MQGANLGNAEGNRTYSALDGQLSGSGALITVVGAVNALLGRTGGARSVAPRLIGNR